MRDTVKKIINFRFDYYEETEIKLAKLAEKGLFLIERGPLFWTFKKGPPRKLKYAITYFLDGSIFNPGITNNQQTYFDYAKAANWNFVTGYDQMQIFCSEFDNPIPLEVDEKKKLDNIKICMKKSFIPSLIAMLLLLASNLFVQFNSFVQNPIDFLSNPIRLLSTFAILSAVIYEIYFLLNYFIWCKRSEQSIASGGECIKRKNIIDVIVDMVLISFSLISLAYLLLQLSFKTGCFTLLLLFVQAPIMIFIFLTLIKYLKSKKVSATINKVISYTVLTILAFTYVSLIIPFIIKPEFNLGAQTTYQTIKWPIGETSNQEYRLYSDNIPLTCEDLYGPIDYDYYSYKESIDSSLFLSKKAYRQYSFPEKNEPPQLEYKILEPQFNFIYKIAREHLLKIPNWHDDFSFKTIDNKLFNTIEAYQTNYEGITEFKHILFFENKIIILTMDAPVSIKQIPIIIEKLDI